MLMNRSYENSWPEMTDIINILIWCEFASISSARVLIGEYQIVLRDGVNRKFREHGWSFATYPCRWK